MGWTSNNPIWSGLSDEQKVAAMAIMEAGGKNLGDAMNAAGAMVNRATKEGQGLGAHVSRSIYQPTIERSQESKLAGIVQSPEFKQMTEWVSERKAGRVADPVSGATYFLAHPQTMLSLEAQNPSKYKNWGPRGANWTGYDEGTGQYKNQVFQDKSHAFLAPEGAHSAPGSGTFQAKAPGGLLSPMLAADASPTSVAAASLGVSSPASGDQSGAFANISNAYDQGGLFGVAQNALGGGSDSPVAAPSLMSSLSKDYDQGGVANAAYKALGGQESGVAEALAAAMGLPPGIGTAVSSFLGGGGGQEADPTADYMKASNSAMGEAMKDDASGTGDAMKASMNASLEAEKLGKQALSGIFAGQGGNVDLSRIAKILQARTGLGTV